MAEVSRRRLQITFISTSVTFVAFTLAIYFVAVGGGVDKLTAAIVAISTFVIGIISLTWGTINYARNPNYQPKLNAKFFFWCGVPVAFWAFVEIFQLSTGILIAILAAILGAAGLAVPKTVVVTLSWIALGVGMVLAALFLRWAWSRFNAAST